MWDRAVCQKARLARDPRFDGKFFIAVRTTGIYCRTICSVQPPKEENVEYFFTALAAAQAGYRPCLRCRPDSAPGSPAWQGVGSTVARAIRLINNGYLRQASVPELAERLGVSDRHLRNLFHTHIGVSPKSYALYQQCLFAKKLLHQTSISVTDVALASGFDSIRRFNDCFKEQLKLTPTQLRKQPASALQPIELELSYRPPFNWPRMLAFYKSRCIKNMEWYDKHSYGRTFVWDNTRGQFTIHHLADKNKFKLEINLDDIQVLHSVVQNIKRIFDLDSDIEKIEADLSQLEHTEFKLTPGLRLPGIWNLFEAGVRAILGQQISIVSAQKLVSNLVNELGEEYEGYRYFPSPKALADSSLQFLKMPGARKDTLRRLGEYFLNSRELDDPRSWVSIKGIGPWTVQYALMRGVSHPDVQLVRDAGIKKALKNRLTLDEYTNASPWRSYLTLHLWETLYG